MEKVEMKRDLCKSRGENLIYKMQLVGWAIFS